MRSRRLAGRAPLIALLSDFGLTDPFVGQVQAVLASLSPGVPWVDLTHEVPPGDIEAGAFLLQKSLPYFPKGTVCLAVVDPGVGSSRRALALEAGPLRFVGPDNGLLTAALRGFAPIRKAVSIRPFPGRKRPCVTFDGRDLFAPAAAALAMGRPLGSLGKSADPRGLLSILPAEPHRTRQGIVGRVVWVDRYGNLVTNLPSSLLHPRARVTVGNRRVIPVGTHYAQAKKGGCLALPGAFGTVEVAVNLGRADRVLGAGRGTKVFVRE